MKPSQHPQTETPQTITVDISPESLIPDKRGQTTTDFLVGVSLLLFTISFIVLAIPGLIDPFEPGSGDASAILSDRVADQLTHNVLVGDRGTLYILDEECTVAFFNGSATSACDVSSDSPQEIFGVSERTSVRVEIRDQAGNPIQIDGQTFEITDGGVAGQQENVFNSQRVVYINGERYLLVVAVW